MSIRLRAKSTGDIGAVVGVIDADGFGEGSVAAIDGALEQKSAKHSVTRQMGHTCELFWLLSLCFLLYLHVVSSLDLDLSMGPGRPRTDGAQCET